jgi:hypothetical protein
MPLNCGKTVSDKCAHLDPISSLVFDPLGGKPMAEKSQAQKSAGVWTIILTDAHFWVPAIVLVAGLLVLQWIR